MEIKTPSNILEIKTPLIILEIKTPSNILEIKTPSNILEIRTFAYMVSPHGYHTSGVTSLFEPNFISQVTLLNEDYFVRFYAYKYIPVNYVTL